MKTIHTALLVAVLAVGVGLLVNGNAAARDGDRPILPEDVVFIEGRAQWVNMEGGERTLYQVPGDRWLVISDFQSIAVGAPLELWRCTPIRSHRLRKRVRSSTIVTTSGFLMPERAAVLSSSGRI